MDKGEIIERLRRIADHAVHTVGERPFIMSLDDGIAVHEAIELLEQIRWRPVSEGMPKPSDCPMDCLVTRKGKYIGNYTDMAVAESDGTWTHEDWKAITFGDRVLGKKAGLISTRDDDIVAWMPLPEPWKGDNDGQTD
jgi:hypothetical protein